MIVNKLLSRIICACVSVFLVQSHLAAQQPLQDNAANGGALNLASPPTQQPAVQGGTPAPAPVQMQLSDQGATASPTPAPQAPQPTSPNVASLGNGQFNQLTSSPYYVAPFAASLGLASSSGGTLGGYFGSGVHQSLLESPEMFGDFRRPGTSLSFMDPHSYYAYNSNDDDESDGRGSDFPTAGSFSGMRVSENNVALPQDRVWASYHHYRGAYALAAGDLDLDRFVIGVEKTFDSGSGSVEVRLPMAGSLDPVDTTGNSYFAGGSFGNLQVVVKKVLIATGERVIACGCAIETPTGSQTHAVDHNFGTAEFTYDPKAVYLTPFLATLRKFDDIWFLNSFAQFEVATSGDSLVTSLNGGPQQQFYINQPTLFMFDIGGGVWLTTPSQQRAGIALTSELHLAQALSDDDSFAVDAPDVLPNVFVDFDSIRTILNSTTGLHAQVSDKLSVRTAISVPLLEQRIFDTEFMVQVNHNY